MLDPRTHIGLVSLKVADLPGLTKFYQKVIGLVPIHQENDRVILGAGGRQLVELLAQPEGHRLNYATSLYHLALRVPSRADLGSWLIHYAGLDSPFWQGASDHDVSEALYLSDPEGNGIEIYADRPKSKWTFMEDGRIRIVTDPLNIQSLLDAAKEKAWTGMPEGTDMGISICGSVRLLLSSH